MKLTEKTLLLDKLEQLLNKVAGCETPWDHVERSLRKLNVQEVRALLYRVERSMSNSYDEGYAEGERRAPT